MTGSDADATPSVPPPVLGLYDGPMWDSIAEERMQLQRCGRCGGWQYPPGPNCPHCLSPDLVFTPVSGRGVIYSWVRFHRQYFPIYPAPHVCVAVRLEEGVLMMGTLDSPTDRNDLIDCPVRLVYGRPDGKTTLPRFALSIAPLEPAVSG